MAKSNAGGGPLSNKTKSVGLQTGAPAEGRNVKAVSQIGTAIDPKSREQMAAPRPAGGAVKLGNEVALNSKSAPGQGRTIMPSGSQHGLAPAKPMPAGRNTLAEFGKDIPGRK